MPKEVKNSIIYYGWFVVVACSALTIVFGGISWSFGVFFKPLESEFGYYNKEAIDYTKMK